MQHPPPEHDPRHRQDIHDRGHYQPHFRPFADQPPRPATSQPSHSGLSERHEELHDPGVNGHVVPPSHHRMSPRSSHTPRSTPGPNGQAGTRDGYNPSYREEQHSHAGLFRPSYAPYAGHHTSAVLNGHREDLDYRGPRNELVFGRPVHRQTPPPSELSRYDIPPRAAPSRNIAYTPHPYDGHAHEQHVRRDVDPLHHRSLLDVSAEIARKNGRSSPLPQAVQGAQPRHTGPTADPGIKNEFGRMFPGLGLGGMGSNTPIAGMSANGSATPSRMSPATHSDSHDVPGLDVDGASTTSRTNKRGRKAKDDAAKENGDGTDDTHAAAQQQSKRAKTTHPAHHHHHHHHHHSNLAEEQVAAGPSPFNTIRFPANPNAAQPAPHHHHHHHHHHHVHAPHHHHHTPKPMASLKMSEITVSNEAVLSTISHRPRKHLGSELYKTRLGLPPRDSTPLDTKLHFKSQMRPMPFFEDKENCTFTIRVPRGYLKSIATSEDEHGAIAGGLEEICKTRAVWGTDVYTDDSDVVAAAVHSGWLRGDFGDFNGDIQDLFSEEDGHPSTATPGTLVSQKPTMPLRSASDADLHITILVLPPLAHYTATTKNHLRSREWGAHHDGMSFMIHSIQFIQEGKATRFTERTAAAKHQRIAEELMRRNEAAESLMGLLKGGNSVSVSAY